MTDAPTYELRSLESELARPRKLAAGSLKDCLLELVEAALTDVTAANRSTLVIDAIYPNGGQGSVVEVLTARLTGQGY